MEEDATLEFLTKLILQGESIIAEIVRLSNFVPKEFQQPTKSKYCPLLLDFKYFEKHEQFENEFSNNTRLQTLFYSSFGPVIIAFEQLFSSIADFVITFQKYAAETEVRREIDRVAEFEAYCLYLCGMMFIYLDKYLEGSIRERLYVAIYRKSDTRYQAEFLVDFLKTTNGHNGFIGRISIPTIFLKNCMNTVEEVHIAKNEQHLAPKMAQMYVVLLFNKPTLASDTARMNKIVNSIYRENWVFNLGFGIIVNIFDAWYPHKSAWNALNAMISAQEAIRIADGHLLQFKSINVPKMVGEMTAIDEHLTLISQWNRSLKWLMLHTRPTTRGKGLVPKVTEQQLFQWLLEISAFEMKFIDGYKAKIRNRTSEAISTKTDICEALKQLSNFIELLHTNLGQKTQFIKWIDSLRQTVDDMKIGDENGDDENIIDTCKQIHRRLKQAGEMLGFETNMTLKEHLTTIRAMLKSLAGLVGLSGKRDMLLRKVQQKIGDSDWIWAMMEDVVVKGMETKIDDASVIRQMFGKLSISIEMCKMKLETISDENNSGAIRRIVATYSWYLEGYLRKVLQSVPKHLFEVMWTVIVPSLADNKMSGYVDKQSLQIIEETLKQSKLVEATYSITNMSMGISRMMLRRIGSLRINPKQLLEDGMIRQLYKEIKRIMSNGTMEKVLENCQQLEIMRNAFIYMCEFMNLDGQVIWNIAMDDYFGRIGDEKPMIVDMVVKATHPKTSRYSEDQMVWKDQKAAKLFSFDSFEKIERMIPFYALSSIETAAFQEFEHVLKDHLTTWRKICVISNFSQNRQITSEFFGTAEYEKLVKQVAANSQNLVAQLAQIGQLILILKAISTNKRNCNELRENRFQSELQILNKCLAENPSRIPVQHIPTLLQLFTFFSLFDAENVRFRVKDDISPVLIIALIQCIMSKIGDSIFVCTKQLKIGVRFVLRHSKYFVEQKRILMQQLPRVRNNGKQLKDRKRMGEVERFFDGLMINL